MTQRASGGCRSVLIVTGSERTRRMYGEYLGWRGVHVVEVDTASAAVDELSRFQPDAVVTEDRLPDSTGPELVRALRRSRPTCDLPIVLLCSDTFAIQVDDAAKYGCDRILIVPLIPEALLDVLDEILEQHRDHPSTFASWLFTRNGETIWMVRTTERELAIAGPGREREVFEFSSERELLSFQAEYERRLESGGFTLQMTGDDRRSGHDRRRSRRASGPERRAVD